MRKDYYTGRNEAEQWYGKGKTTEQIRTEHNLIHSNNLGSHISEGEKKHWLGYLDYLRERLGKS